MTTATWNFDDRDYFIDLHISPSFLRSDKEVIEPLDTPGLPGRRYRLRGTRPQAIPLRGFIGLNQWADCAIFAFDWESRIGQELTVEVRIADEVTTTWIGPLLEMRVEARRSQLVCETGAFPYHIELIGVFEVDQT